MNKTELTKVVAEKAELTQKDADVAECPSIAKRMGIRRCLKNVFFSFRSSCNKLCKVLPYFILACGFATSLLNYLVTSIDNFEACSC